MTKLEKIYGPDFEENFLTFLHEKESFRNRIKEIIEFSRQYSVYERRFIAFTSWEEKNKTKRKEVIHKFYEQQGKIMDNFYESLKKGERNIEKISKENNITFFHSITPDDQANSGKKGAKRATDVNNRIVNQDKITNEEMIKILLGMNPTISTSFVNNENTHMLHSFISSNFGLIVSGGNLLILDEADASTYTDGIKSKRRKHISETSEDALMHNIEEGVGIYSNEYIGTYGIDPTHKIKNLLNSKNTIQERCMKEDDGCFNVLTTKANRYNEAIIEKPIFSGMYVKIDEPVTYFGESTFRENYIDNPISNSELEINYQYKIIFSDVVRAMYLASKANLPLYMLINGKTYLLTNNGRIEVDRKDLIDNKIKHNSNDKKKMIEDTEYLFESIKAKKDIELIKNNIPKNIQETKKYDELPDFEKIKSEIQIIFTYLNDTKIIEKDINIFDLYQQEIIRIFRQYENDKNKIEEIIKSKIEEISNYVNLLENYFEGYVSRKNIIKLVPFYESLLEKIRVIYN